MKCVEKGHVYDLRNRVVAPAKGRESMNDHVGSTQQIRFLNLQPGQENSGTTTQEVLRALIDRTRHCGNCMPHPINERVVYHLRMALVLHEARALERRVEKDGLAIENATIDGHGHLLLDSAANACSGVLTPVLDPHPMDGAKIANHPRAA